MGQPTPAPERSPSVLRWLTKVNHIPFNPAAEIELPRQPKTLPKAILSADEVEQVLSQPDTTTPLGLRDRAILETFYSTGIRRAELCSLNLDDIHVDRQALFVNQGKGKKDRYVPIGMRALWSGSPATSKRRGTNCCLTKRNAPCS